MCVYCILNLLDIIWEFISNFLRWKFCSTTSGCWRFWALMARARVCVAIFNWVWWLSLPLWRLRQLIILVCAIIVAKSNYWGHQCGHLQQENYIDDDQLLFLFYTHKFNLHLHPLQLFNCPFMLYYSVHVVLIKF